MLLYTQEKMYIKLILYLYTGGQMDYLRKGKPTNSYAELHPLAVTGSPRFTFF